jgi:hypothetical protein
MAEKALENNPAGPPNSTLDELSQAASPAPIAHNKLASVTTAVLFTLLLLLPFWFGGTPANADFSSQVVIFLLVAAWLFLAPAETAAAWKNTPLARQVLWCLLVFFAYAGASYLWSSGAPEPHPVFRTVRAAFAAGKTLSALRDLLCFMGLFFLTYVLLCSLRKFAPNLIKVLMLSGLLAALVALAHWFYDNGRLFWTFEPQNVFISERARWPFVNANHLAHFLLPVFFLSLSSFANQLTNFWKIRAALPEPRRKKVSDLFLSQTLQAKLMGLAFSVILLLTILLAVLASMSRGSWCGLSVGLLVFAFAFGRFSPAPITLKEPQSARPPHSKEHRRRKESSLSIKVKSYAAKSSKAFIKYGFKPALVLLALAVIYFFLSGRGSELIESRIEYGLLYSKDDMRWMLFSDTLSMVKSHLLCGVGLGQWSQYYPQYMSQLLSGINPVYLHSDPLQVLAEVGLIGITPLLVCGALLFRGCLGSFKTQRKQNGVLLLGLASGMIAFLVSSFFDFPFRIPAISNLFAVYLALTVFYVFQAKSSQLPASSSKN